MDIGKKWFEQRSVAFFKVCLIFLQAHLFIKLTVIALLSRSVIFLKTLKCLRTDFPGFSPRPPLLFFLVQNLDQKLLTSVGNTPVFALSLVFSCSVKVSCYRLYHFTRDFDTLRTESIGRLSEVYTRVYSFCSCLSSLPFSCSYN